MHDNFNYRVRDAIKDDFLWVSQLMQCALEPYYGGDHNSHAKRIFDAHMAGGKDRFGFFSVEQQMFIVEVSGLKAGLLHLVRKKQSTYKISPLIISEEYHGKLGLGSILLSYAENYIYQNHNARQIYCTVAESNIAALQFFLKKGFIIAGKSESHYKDGIIEVMMYKPLNIKANQEVIDKTQISILPLNEIINDSREKIKGLLLDYLPESFDGIDDEWVSSLFAGFNRRGAEDINTKFKLIFVALSANMEPLGIIGATPKKGQPIKVMPLVARDINVFEALLIDIPFQLVKFGHKLYTHINPSAEQVQSLQKMGWRLDAAMPSAYKRDIVTQQWSLNINKETIRRIRVKEKFFDAIQKGSKDIEVRVGYETIRNIIVGERIIFTTHNSIQKVKISKINNYPSFNEMIKNECYLRIMPWAKQPEDVIELLKQYYPPNKEKLGVVALNFVKVDE